MSHSLDPSSSGVKRRTETDHEVLQDAELSEPIRKQMKMDHHTSSVNSQQASQVTPLTTAPINTPLNASLEEDDGDEKPRKLLAPPFFYYRDHSTEVDDDPLKPLTPLARVPNFPAKMHAILSRPDLSDIVAWMPHGRSWRVLKPREFEIRVIPTYFDHQKFSSFIRQANGWGFRRITQGRDRNSYYNELFLRGMPYLCKQMKRPGVSKKVNVDAEHEPDFYAISDMHPLPDESDADGNILLPCTLMGGPKARVPVGMMGTAGHDYDGTALAQSQLQQIMLGSGGGASKPPSSATAQKGINLSQVSTTTQSNTASETSSNTAQSTLPGQGVLGASFRAATMPENTSNPTLPAFNQMPMAALASLNQLPAMNTTSTTPFHQNPAMLSALLQQQSINTVDSKQTSEATLQAMLQAQSQLYLSTVAANQQAAAMQQAISMAMHSNTPSRGPTPNLGSDPASQFAAGFAAATAVSDSQFRSALSKVLSANAAATTGATPNASSDHGGTKDTSGSNTTSSTTPTPNVDVVQQGHDSTAPNVENFSSFFSQSRKNFR